MTGEDVVTRRFLAISVVIGFFGALAALLFLPSLNPNVRETVAMLIGVLGAKFGTVYDFAFGNADRFGGTLRGDTVPLVSSGTAGDEQG